MQVEIIFDKKHNLLLTGETKIKITDFRPRFAKNTYQAKS